MIIAITAGVFLYISVKPFILIPLFDPHLAGRHAARDGGSDEIARVGPDASVLVPNQCSRAARWRLYSEDTVPDVTSMMSRQPF